MKRRLSLPRPCDLQESGGDLRYRPWRHSLRGNLERFHFSRASGVTGSCTKGASSLTDWIDARRGAREPGKYTFLRSGSKLDMAEQKYECNQESFILIRNGCEKDE